MEKSKITEINIFKEKGKPPVSLEKVCCSLDLGLQGDRFAKGGEKQLTLLDNSTRDWMEKSDVKGLCFSRFTANLLTQNLDVSSLNTGDILFCGGAVLQVSSSKKECFDQCILRQNNINCELKKGGIYLKVTGGGNIQINDEIKSKL